MFDKLAGIERRYEELDQLLADPANLSDYSRVTEFAQERAEIEPIVQAYREHQSVQKQLEEARAMLEGETDSELRTMAEEEAESLSGRITALEEQLKSLLLPK